jgi:SAM-dependent methyltransferase
LFEQDLAELYDLLYEGRGKDYGAEAERITDLIRARKPDAATLLDVACGTGAHLVHLRERFDRVEGLERAAGMRAVAARKLPGVPLHSGDMCDFALGAGYDAVVSLFASVGYLRTVEQLDAAIARLAAHAVPGGVVVVEPWWFPERFLDGYVAGHVVRRDGCTVSRMSRSTRMPHSERGVTMEIHVTAADRNGMRHFTETHVMTLFSLDEHLSALRAASCEATYPPGWPSGCGLFVAVRS